MDEARIAAKALHDFRREHYREGPRWEDIDWGHQERWVLSMKAALEAIASQPVPAPDLVERVKEALRQASFCLDAGGDVPSKGQELSLDDLLDDFSPAEADNALDVLARAIIQIIQADEREEWQPVETAPAACCVLAARFDHDIGDWVMAYVMSPPSKPFTHWLFIKGPPASAALKAGDG